MKAKHSPSPWRWNYGVKENHFGNMPILEDANNENILDFGDSTPYYPTEGNPPNDANAKLIAAAPELLEALQEIVKENEFRGYGDSLDSIKAKEVIKKATE